MARRLRRRGGIASDLVKGAVAGAVATFVMGRVTGYMYEHEDRDARRQEDLVRGGRRGDAMHWALGMGAGAVYAVLRRRVQGLGRAAGTAFGTGFWVVLDEGVIPALGVTAGPRAFPWQAHARGLVGHLTFGTVTDGTLRLLDRVT